MSDFFGAQTYTYAITAGALLFMLLVGWLAGKFLSTRISRRRRGKQNGPPQNIADLKRRLERVNIEVDVYLHQVGREKGEDE